MNEAVTETPNVLVRLKYYAPDGGNGTYSGRRSFYASAVADDYMKYIDKGIKDGDESESPNADYIGYVGNGAKSAGVFGKDGSLSKTQKAEMRGLLRATDSVIWDMVISFKDGFGGRYMRDTAAAQSLLKAHLNRFFKQAGLIPDNTEWFAGLHTNTDNRHIHVCFFEREPMFLRRGKDGKHYRCGKLRQTGIDGFKLAVRIGNRVIGFALNVRKCRDKDRRVKAARASPATRRIARRDFLGSLTRCLKLKAIAEAECMADFTDYLKRLEEATPNAEYEREEEHERDGMSM